MNSERNEMRLTVLKGNVLNYMHNTYYFTTVNLQFHSHNFSPFHTNDLPYFNIDALLCFEMCLLLGI